MPTPPMNNSSLSQTVDIETPELVMLSYNIAGVGSRASAALIDYAICVAGFIVVYIGFSVFAVNTRSASSSGR